LEAARTGSTTGVHPATLVKTALAVAATAVAGSAATAPTSDWYRSLRKPRWQPPAAAFPAVWTPLYALLAVAGARVLDRTAGNARTAFIRAYGVNLALNAGWTIVFFRARRPKAALAEILVLNASNVILLRRSWHADRLAGAAVLPYVAWTGFATALNASIVALNPASQDSPASDQFMPQHDHESGPR
jgi:benzodiazapine receptor